MDGTRRAAQPNFFESIEKEFEKFDNTTRKEYWGYVDRLFRELIHQLPEDKLFDVSLEDGYSLGDVAQRKRKTVINHLKQIQSATRVHEFDHKDHNVFSTSPQGKANRGYLVASDQLKKRTI